MYNLILLRHGESIWNKENRFTGWEDVGLSEKGVEEAKNAGVVLKKNGFHFDIAYTSILSRTNLTLQNLLDTMNEKNIEIIKAWELNERHYGALQGLNKEDTINKYGKEQVHIWRRSFDIPPPSLETNDERAIAQNKKFSYIDKNNIPLTESLKDTIQRVIPYFKNFIAPQILKGKKIIIVAHGNSLRGLVKFLDNISDSEISELNIPTATPLVYKLDANLKSLEHYYL